MAFAHVQTDHAYPGTSTKALTGSPASGELVVVSSSAVNGANPTAPSKSSGTATIGTVFGPVTRASAGGTVQVWAWYFLITGTGTLTLALDTARSDNGYNISRFTGALTGADPLRTSATSTAETSTLTPATAAYTPTAGDLEYSAYGNEADAPSLTDGAGWTRAQYDVSHIDQEQYNLNAPGTSHVATVTLGTASNAWAMVALVFKPASTGPPPDGTAPGPKGMFDPDLVT